MKKVSEAGRRMKRLRQARDLDQAQFAKELKQSPSAISAWEIGASAPPPEVLVKLARLACGEDAIWFLKRAGVGEQVILSAADYILQGRVIKAKALSEREDVILVPRFRETLQGREPAGLDVPLPAELIPHPRRTICIVADEKSTGIVHAPRGLIVLDTSTEGAADLSALWDTVLMLHLAPGVDRRPALQQGGIYMGRLILHPVGADPARFWLGAALNTLGPYPMGFDMVYLRIRDEGAPIALPSEPEARQRLIEKSYAGARSKFRLTSEARILGQVIGRLTGHFRPPRGEKG